MQLSPTASPATPAPVATPAIAPGTVLGTGVMRVVTTGGIQFHVDKRVDITAGATVMSGIRDIRAAAQELIHRTWEGPGHDLGGLVGFVANGDTYDAVKLLAPRFTDGSSLQQVWAPWNVAGFRPVDDLVAVWHVTPYGGDANLRQPDSMFPPTLPVAPPN